MNASLPVFGIAEFLAHAVAIEADAVDRYRALATIMREKGNEAAARLFAELEKAETDHLVEIERKAAELGVRDLAPGEFRWRGGGSPECIPLHGGHAKLSTIDALKLVLAAEKKAFAFFESAALSASPTAVKAMARKMAAEEAGHVAIIAERLAKGLVAGG